MYEVDPLECTQCGTTMRIITLVDEAEMIKRILKHLKVWDPQGTRSFSLDTGIQRPFSIPGASPKR